MAGFAWADAQGPPDTHRLAGPPNPGIIPLPFFLPISLNRCSMTVSIVLFNCGHCVDSFAFDWEKIKDLKLHSRVSVRCPACGNTVQLVTNAYELIHDSDPAKYRWADILEILPPDPKATPESTRLDLALHLRIHRKKYGWQPS